ncbi:hypothetical protein GCM10027040_29510 [Halomonas shantousis]
MIRKVGLRLTLDDECFNIPYASETHENGEIHPYRSLVSVPEAVETIPEIEHQPFLKSLLYRIHSPQGLFETARIERWYTERGHHTLHIVALGFLFRDRKRFASFEECMMVTGKLLQACHSSEAFENDEDAAQLEFQRARLTDERIDGWIMDLFIYGQGSNARSADRDLKRKVRVLEKVLDAGQLASSIR